MAQPRYTRIDNNNNRRPASTSYWSTVTVVVFVALCLVGIWMMTSSSLGPDQNVDEVSLDNKDVIKKQMTPPVEEASSETPTENKQGDGNENLPQVQEDENSSKQEEKSKEEVTNEDKKGDSDANLPQLQEDEGLTKQEDQEGKKEEKTTELEKDSDEKNDLKDKLDEENPESNGKETKPVTEETESSQDGENQKKAESEDSEKKFSDDVEKKHAEEEDKKFSEDVEAKHAEDGEKKLSDDDEKKLSEDDKKFSDDVESKHVEDEDKKFSEDVEAKHAEDDEKKLSDDDEKKSSDDYKKFSDNVEKKIAEEEDKKFSDDVEAKHAEDDEKKLSDDDKKFSDDVEKKHAEDDEKKLSDDDKKFSDDVESKHVEDEDKKFSDDVESKHAEDDEKKFNDDVESKHAEDEEQKSSDNVKSKNVEDEDKKFSEDVESKHVEDEDKKFSDDVESKHVENDKETETQKENRETNVDQQESQPKNETSSDIPPPVAQLELLNETTPQNGSFSTQATESKNEKEAQKGSSSDNQVDYKWTLCNTTAGPDYIPCLDNVQAIKSLQSTKHYEHRERHCPDSPPSCLVPLPDGYKQPIEWPKSREKIWYTNVPHTKLAEYKGHQNWVKVTGEYLTFPGGGTQFKHGALHYIDFIQESVSDIAWGKRSRVILDVGCGVASFGGFLFDRDVITMSLAPKDEHEAQVQFALERGIPAISAVMGTTRLPFPGRVFDMVHCARCRVPWHIEGGKLLLELNRVLRPGGFFVWSATPVYQKKTEDVEIWEAMSELTKKMCWELISINKDTINGVGVATYKKPTSNECYTKRTEQQPPICPDSDDPNASWKVPLQACMHSTPENETQRGSQWPEQWPPRLEKPPFWLLSSQTGVYGKTAPEDFTADYEHWKRVVTKSYLKGLGINWSSVRNVMDMRAVYGGFAAALRDLKVWVMNVVPIDSPDTLAIIYERGLFGIYHDWCKSFSTYPRSYDLLHADHLFSKLKQRCNLTAVIAEVDRVLRPEGKLIVRDDAETIQQVEAMVKAMKWEVRMTYSKDKEGLLSVQKSIWRPNEVETLAYTIA